MKSFERGSNSYDEIGEVPYLHHSMAAYLVEAKVEPPEPFRLGEPVPCDGAVAAASTRRRARSTSG